MCLVRLRRGGDDEFRGGDQFPAGGVVLADPGLVVAEVVEPLEQFHVAADGERRVLAEPVERGEEDAEFQAAMRHTPCLRLPFASYDLTRR